MNKYTLRQLLLLLAVMMVLPSYSQDKARCVAERFLSQKMSNSIQRVDSIGNHQTLQRPSYELVYEKKKADKSLLYVFSNEEQKQFAIVTANEDEPLIIGYSLNQSFDKDNIIPPVKAFMDAYAQAAKNGMLIRKADVTEKAPIWPLVKTKWGQEYPYNICAPTNDMNPSMHMLVGCGPLAMGQIMKYYEYPTSGIGEHGGVNFAEQTYDFSKMIEGHASESGAHEVAKLLNHSAVACDATYDWFGTGSTASANIQAMCEHFGYSSQATLEFRMNKTDEEWDALIYNELANHRPIIYAGYPEYEGDGHIFIVDGYNDGYYHVNWGWNGKDDGYYQFNGMLDYNDMQQASIGLAPDGWTSKEEESSNLFTVGLCDNTIAQLPGGEGKNTAMSNIPYSHLAAYSGKKIIGVQIGLAEDATGLEVRLKTAQSSAPFFVKQVGNGHTGWNTFMFDESTTVPDDGIYIEYEYESEQGKHPVGGSVENPAASMYERDYVQTFIVFNDGVFGKSFWSTPLAFRLILAEDTEMPADLRILNMEQARVLSGSHLKTTGIIENTSGCPVSNYTLKYKIDDNPVQTRLMNQSLKKDERTFFSLDIEDEFVPGSHELRVWVGEVDGQPDAVFANSNYYVTNPLTFNIAGDKSFPRTHVAMANVDVYCYFSDIYKEIQETVEKSGMHDCIYINNHVQNIGPDPMADVIGTMGGGSTPDLYVNGIYHDDYESLSYLISSCDQTSIAKIEGNASFSADKKQIIVNTTTSFAYPGNNNYCIDYVLVEDNMGPFEDVGDVVFNHVTRGIYHTSNSVVTTPYSPNMPQACSYAIPLLENVHKTSNLHVVAMLIDDRSREIVNAVDMSIADSDAPVFALDKPNLSLLCDVTEKLNVIDSNVPSANAEDYVFASSNENVVKILEDGFIRATGAGSAVVTCNSKNGSGTAQCKVTVRDWINQVTVETPGTLRNLVGLLDFKELKVNGQLDAMDMRYIRALTGGSDDYSTDQGGSVRRLNLKDATLVSDKRPVTKEGEYRYGNQSFDYSFEYKDLIYYSTFTNSPINTFICPKSLKGIEDYAFYGSSLRNVTFFEGIEQIGFSFLHLILNSVYLPSTVSSLGGSFKYSQVDYCWVDSHNPNFMAYNNDIYTKDSKTLVHYSNSTRYALELPDWCTAIGDYLVFEDFGTLYFKGMGIVNVGVEFTGRNWNKAIFGPKVKNVSGDFILSVENLKYIVMPPLTPPALDNLRKPAFKEVSEITLYVNPESLELYKIHPEWSKFFVQPMTQEMLDETSGIDCIISNPDDVTGVYALDGKKVQKIRQGVNIIRNADGTVRKVIKK